MYILDNFNTITEWSCVNNSHNNRSGKYIERSCTHTTYTCFSCLLSYASSTWPNERESFLVSEKSGFRTVSICIRKQSIKFHLSDDSIVPSHTSTYISVNFHYYMILMTIDAKYPIGFWMTELKPWFYRQKRIL